VQRPLGIVILVPGSIAGGIGPDKPYLRLRRVASAGTCLERFVDSEWLIKQTKGNYKTDLTLTGLLMEGLGLVSIDLAAMTLVNEELLETDKLAPQRFCTWMRNTTFFDGVWCRNTKNTVFPPCCSSGMLRAFYAHSQPIAFSRQISCLLAAVLIRCASACEVCKLTDESPI
jgi:hypothetical protein